MKLFQIASAAILTILPVASATHPAYAAFAAVAPSATVTQFQVADATEVPGKTLKPGSYSITVVDHLSDRLVLRVLDSDGKEAATFLAVPATAQFPTEATAGPVDMKAGKGKLSALRGFRFPDGTSAEFVYPKAEAVSLAKANSTTVPAIDPASEGRVDATKLSRTDLQLVTLWMLTPTRVGNQSAIQAARYQAPAADVASAAPASNGAPSPAAPTVEARAVTPPRPAPVRTQTMKALPHTASSLPVVWLAGMLALLGAAALSLRRRTGLLR